MPTKSAKGDEVRVDAKRFDGEGDLDELGLKFSERWNSWFASVKTVLALRNELGVHFTGPVKTATSNYPIEPMRHTLAKMNRGEHIVFKCLDVPNLWAVGWHDHHFKCYITTHGVTTPGKPAPKRRQDILGHNWLKEVARPDIIAKYRGEMGFVDRHNQFRQGYLHLAKVWKTIKI